MADTKRYSIVIPAYNEAGAIDGVLQDIRLLPHGQELEIVVVNDCSTDGTLERLRAHKDITLISNAQNSGYGYSLKRGIGAATHENIVIIDADGSYPVRLLPELMREYEKGFDMVVGARQGLHYRGSLTKRFARLCFRLLSEFSTGRKIPDINSGCRIFRKDVAVRFFHTLSSGFSFTTTITLAFMLNACSVRYMPIEYHKRTGKSKVKYFKDTIRAAQIIVEAIAIYNPLKLFLIGIIGILAVGIVSLIIALLGHYLLAMLFFWTVTLMIVVFSLGLIATILRFIYGVTVR